jgi:hypothetical protein
MNTLVKGLKKESNKTTTLNGAKIKKSSLNSVVDLFFAVGASRGKDIVPLFQRAVSEDLDLAVRVALYARDAREGMGERKLFRDMMKWFANADFVNARRVLAKIPELGRFDDLLAFVGTPIEHEALEMYSAELRNGNGLAAKWAPREKSAKKALATKLRTHMGLTPREYRKMLASLSTVVEQDMCARKWSEIDYNHVPSVAAARYQKAFSRNDEQRYAKYRESLVKNDGTAKINAAAVYPYDILRSIRYGDSDVAEAQWNALPNWIENGRSFLPMIDVSGSMGCPAGGMSMTCMDVAVSLGLYCAQRNQSAFKDMYLTFHSNPTFGDVSGMSLKSAFNSIMQAPWGMNTDLEKAYRLILDTAVKNNVPQEDMPEFLIIFSDMQFDQSTRGRGVNKDITKRFTQAGYTAPKLVYWNLNDYGRNTPVEFTKEGACLVSGFSPALMKSILSVNVESFTPINIVKDAVMKDRYNW